MRLLFRSLALLAALPISALAQPASAQDRHLARDAAQARSADRLTIGLGGVLMPKYEGASETTILPIPAAIGKIGGFSVLYVGNRMSVDLVKDGASSWDFQFGPSASIGINRTSVEKIDDARIRALGKIGRAVELGGQLGVARWGVITSDYDRLSTNVTMRHDVAGVHGGTTITPSISYMTPLSTKALVMLSAAANHVDGDYAGRYFSINPEQSAASGLPVYTAGSGWRDWSFAAASNVSLTGDLTGGLSLVAGFSYTRMLGDIAASPVVSIAGSRDQWLAGLGLAYTF